MTTVSPDSRSRIARTLVQAIGAAVLAAPVVVAGLHLTAARASAVEAVIAAFVAAVSTAQNVAEDFGILPSWLRFSLPAPAARVPHQVADVLAEVSTVAKAGSTVEQAAKGVTPKA